MAPDRTEPMRAAVFEGHERIVLKERPLPSCGPNDAIVRVTLTTICGTDVHIWREEYPVEPGRIACGSCFFCQSHTESQCSGHEDEWKMIGGWRLGNSIDGVQAEFFRVPYAQANLAKIPDDLTDEQCVLLADIASTGISAAERAEVFGNQRNGVLKVALSP
jgi:alcohol dehydrogenase